MYYIYHNFGVYNQVTSYQSSLVPMCIFISCTSAHINHKNTSKIDIEKEENKTIAAHSPIDPHSINPRSIGLVLKLPDRRYQSVHCPEWSECAAPLGCNKSLQFISGIAFSWCHMCQEFVYYCVFWTSDTREMDTAELAKRLIDINIGGDLLKLLI